MFSLLCRLLGRRALTPEPPTSAPDPDNHSSDASDSSEYNPTRTAQAWQLVKACSIEFATLLEPANGTRSVWSHESFQAVGRWRPAQESLWVRYGQEKCEFLRRLLTFWVGGALSPTEAFIRLTQLSLEYGNYLRFFTETATYDVDWYNNVIRRAYHRYVGMLGGTGSQIDSLLDGREATEAAWQVEANVPPRVKTGEVVESEQPGE